MITKSDISFIQPSRNNLKYLKWSYDSIRKNGGSEPHICVADDFSSDGTWEWCQQMMLEDKNFHAIRNEGPTRLGHTILYDRLINEVATTKIVGIYHADMWLCPGAIESILKYIEPKTVVSLTRIEPDLHPAGPEKVLINNAPTEPEDFKEEWFIEFFNTYLPQAKDRTTEGIFAPWFLFKEDFTSIGGHDPLYAPQSKEDSDIFNRFLLNGYQFIQTWEGCVFHLTCRGSRFNPTLTTPGKNSSEWEAQNERSTRNFIRKWGHFVQHDPLMKPIVDPKYNIGIILDAGRSNLLALLEPWCDTIYIKDYNSIVPEYIAREQPNTSYSLSERIKPYDNEKNCVILLKVDGDVFMSEDFQIIQQLPRIIKQYGEPGRFQLGNMVVEIIQMNEYQNSLINLKTNG
jgi:glycosyltransferase involved in cell wall biosynthesis